LSLCSFFSPISRHCLRLFPSPLIYLLPPINLLLIPISPLVSYFCHFTLQYCLSVTFILSLFLVPLSLFNVSLVGPYHILPALLFAASLASCSLSLSLSLCC
jgi:hypothetical protein